MKIKICTIVWYSSLPLLVFFFLMNPKILSELLTQLSQKITFTNQECMERLKILVPCPELDVSNSISTVTLNG